MERTDHVRRLPVGAEVWPGGGVHFRVWAPRRRRVEVVLGNGDGAPAVPLAAEENGYFSALVPQARPGSLYRFRLDGGDSYPDPVSRYQPEGPHGPSQVIDPRAFAWTDAGWRGASLPGQVVYELHVGTFTPEGTWAAAERQLPELADLGITLIEMMPVAEFPGRFGWGYDGVDLFAPYHRYGTPDDLRRFIDRAHGLGVGVIHDVVYNHLGPDGNYLPQFAADYFTDRHTTEWGEAINFDGPNAGPVREFYTANARYWVEEFHFDGLRLDATQNVYDTSEDHILAAVARAVRAAAGGRSTLLVAENEPQEVRLVRPPAQGGCGLDALWNDDFHHSTAVAATGHSDAYYSDYRGAPQELISAVKWGYLYQGQWYTWQRKRRGSPTFGLDPAAFVNFLQNHDQIANSGRGERLHQLTGPGRYRALTALLLLAPNTPMLFQGQEFAASSPFYYFADHGADLARLVRKGRFDFLQQFRGLAKPEMQKCLADPEAPATFERCKLDLAERQQHAGAYALHRDLLRLRRADPVFRAQRRGGVDGAVLGPEAFLLRFFGDGGDDRLLLVNLGRDLHLDPAPEPLLAPPPNSSWQPLWSSEDPPYGGCGTPPLDTEENWRIPGNAAVVLRPAESSVTGP
ncbi:MAG TPA: malto-oligosyltrehalose trehalohydrolase [Gemmataceae bacterium]|nr:malto-oligosyltrehalose trehalohydrolase [Gemmataceae bacterium]